MPKLTDLQVKNAKPKEKQYKISDGEGLYLIITPSGGKWWRFRQLVHGKEKMLSLGVYPDVSLSQAREECKKQRDLILQSIDPSIKRKENH